MLTGYGHQMVIVHQKEEGQGHLKYQGHLRGQGQLKGQEKGQRKDLVRLH